MLNSPTDKPVIVLDLDGTLLETSRRHYGLYAKISADSNLNTLSLDDYWGQRRSGASNLEVLVRQGLPPSQYLWAKGCWTSQIESEHFLGHDIVIPGALQWLRKAQTKCDLVLVTLRSSNENAYAQIIRLGLKDFFTDIRVVTHQNDSASAKANATVGMKVLLWVGDTEVDMNAGRMVHGICIGVDSGMRSAKQLLEAGAESVYESVSHIPINLLESTVGMRSQISHK